jgi:hypothetical protein
LQVEKHISYSDFNGLSRRILKGGQDLPNVPKVFKEFLQKKSGDTDGGFFPKWVKKIVGMKSEQKEVERPQIMLLDEVDVFFGDSFYGQPYR